MSVFLAALSGGVYPGQQDQASSIVADGIPAFLQPTPPGSSPSETLTNVSGASTPVPSTFSPNAVYAPTPQPYAVNILADPSVTAGHPDITLAGLNESLLQDIANTNNLSRLGLLKGTNDGDYSSYTGADIRAIIEIGDVSELATASQIHISKELIELSTISISVHRAKTPVRSCGFIGAKGYSRGGRTIAGTMVFTQFTADILMKFLQSNILTDAGKDTTIVKVDQLPLFNLTLLFSNEYGFVSYRRLLGIDFVTDGTIYSTHDLMSEQTITYVASDYTPLLPIDRSAAFTGNINNPQTNNEATISNVLNKAK